MKPAIYIVDEFLDDFDKARAFAEDAEYFTGLGPDGHEYRNMHPLYGDLTKEIILKSRALFGRAFMPFAALRLSPYGIKSAYRAHSDSFMNSDISLVLYMNKQEHCEGGTSFLRHVSGETQNSGKNEVTSWWQDRNDEAKWSKTMTCPMVENRALFFDSSLIHQSEPGSGFGTTKSDSRCVIIAFFKLER